MVGLRLARDPTLGRLLRQRPPVKLLPFMIIDGRGSDEPRLRCAIWCARYYGLEFLSHPQLHYLYRSLRHPLLSYSSDPGRRDLPVLRNLATHEHFYYQWWLHRDFYISGADICNADLYQSQCLSWNPQSMDPNREGRCRKECATAGG